MKKAARILLIIGVICDFICCGTLLIGSGAVLISSTMITEPEEKTLLFVLGIFYLFISIWTCVGGFIGRKGLKTLEEGKYSTGLGVAILILCWIPAGILYFLAGEAKETAPVE